MRPFQQLRQPKWTSPATLTAKVDLVVDAVGLHHVDDIELVAPPLAHVGHPEVVPLRVPPGTRQIVHQEEA